MEYFLAKNKEAIPEIPDSVWRIELEDKMRNLLQS